ncbi:MAG: riboflavin synthase [Phycisphaerales bacterium]
MFTGLVQHVGVVRMRERHAAGERLVVDPAGWSYQPALGDSVAVNGCCLTIAQEPRSVHGAMVFDVIPETLSRTTLGGLPPGARVNLEHAATFHTLLGGHLVQGHVDGVGRVTGVVTGGEWRVAIEAQGELMEYLAPKGSVCVEGVSLTVAAIRAGAGGGAPAGFDVALIPTTLEKTTLGGLAPGSLVNIECDPIGKQVVQWCRVYAGRCGGR